MMRRPVCLLAVLSLVVAAGCASQRSNYYTLSAPGKPPDAAAGYSVSVGPVSVPEALDRPQIVVRTGTNQVSIDEFQRWASPLPEEIGRAVAGNLGMMLGTPLVSLNSVPTSSGAKYRVLIDVAAFDSELGSSGTLDAFWAVRNPKDGSSRQGRFSVKEAVNGKDYSALVEAHNRALSKLSEEIAGAIRAMEGGR
jgi:uncharacterized lipoprotein YmbA